VSVMRGVVDYKLIDYTDIHGKLIVCLISEQGGAT
jgi:hypothetical protein